MSEPFLMCPRWLLATPKRQLSLPAKIVLLILADHGHRSGQINPRHTTLAKETALSLPTIKRAIVELTTRRLISVASRGQRGNGYKVAPRSDWRRILIAQSDPSETTADSSKRAAEIGQCELSDRPVSLLTEPELINQTKDTLLLSHRNRAVNPGITSAKKPLTENVSLPVQRSLIPDPETVTALVVSAPQTETFEQWFETKFWAHYPRKVGRVNALKIARRIATSPQIRDEILVGLYRQLPALQSRELQFVPHCSTWLGQQRWLDEPEAPPRPKESEHERGLRIAGERFLRGESR